MLAHTGVRAEAHYPPEPNVGVHSAQLLAILARVWFLFQ